MMSSPQTSSMMCERVEAEYEALGKAMGLKKSQLDNMLAAIEQELQGTSAKFQKKLMGGLNAIDNDFNNKLKGLGDAHESALQRELAELLAVLEGKKKLNMAELGKLENGYGALTARQKEEIDAILNRLNGLQEARDKAIANDHHQAKITHAKLKKQRYDQLNEFCKGHAIKRNSAVAVATGNAQAAIKELHSQMAARLRQDCSKAISADIDKVLNQIVEDPTVKKELLDRTRQ